MDVTWKLHVPTADDPAALQAVEAGPLTLDLHDVDLGYEKRAPFTATLNELLPSSPSEHVG
ncbi:hypothetical protein Rhow_001109 [Rhodococcus wratislaviensis]|uniref:Uncharacterized protein n=2 Tax=Rhodococcus wratislaviensis TaxID=44752 RepID=A0A402CN01_RHOWR|nr:hypothetical protein Rhow_001109 [Rhodococcus wratislaviensis]